MGIQDREHLEISSVQVLSSWLSKNHSISNGLWVITYKKSSGIPSPTYEELVREALCYGWIDSASGSVDHARTKLYLSPRKRGSGWSASNKKRIDELLKNGKMKPPGIKVVEIAKEDGSWNKLESESKTK